MIVATVLFLLPSHCRERNAQLFIHSLKHLFMLSRISIEMDFDNSIPFIKVFCNHSSPDLRDRAINVFFEKLQHKSRWATITYLSGVGEAGPNGIANYSNWRITPLNPSQLREEAKLMLAMADYVEGKTDGEPPGTIG